MFILPLRSPQIHSRHALVAATHEAASISLTASTAALVSVPTEGAAGLPQYLLSDASDAALLEATLAPPTPDEHGLYTCRQPPVSFFSLKVTPVFRESIERLPPSELVVSVMDASMLIEDDASAVSKLVRDLATSCQVRGRNVLRWTEAADGSGWDLSGTLELTLQFPMTGIAAVGRRAIRGVGSKLVRETCKSRLRPYLEDVRGGYTAWASIQ